MSTTYDVKFTAFSFPTEEAANAFRDKLIAFYEAQDEAAEQPSVISVEPGASIIGSSIIAKACDLLVFW